MTKHEQQQQHIELLNNISLLQYNIIIKRKKKARQPSYDFIYINFPYEQQDQAAKN